MCYKHLLSLASILLLFACKKNEAPTVNTLTGTWNFIGKRLENFREDLFVSDTEVLKLTNRIGYLSKTASGRLIIDATTFRYDSATFYADSVAIYTTYLNGVLEDSSTAPLKGSVLLHQLSAPYTLISEDSVHLGQGIQLVDDGTSFTVPPIGYRIHRAGDTLILTDQWNTHVDTVMDGTHMTVIEYNIETMKYVKQ